MEEHTITGDHEQIAALDIQHHAARVSWGTVRPDTQQRIRFRDTMREAVAQRRGAFFFAVAYDSSGRPHCVGPHPQMLNAARMAIDAARPTT